MPHGFFEMDIFYSYSIVSFIPVQTDTLVNCLTSKFYRLYATVGYVFDMVLSKAAV